MSNKNLLFPTLPILALRDVISITGLIMIGAKEVMWTLENPALYTELPGYCPLMIISPLILRRNIEPGRGLESQLRIFNVLSPALVTTNQPRGYKVTD